MTGTGRASVGRTASRSRSRRRRRALGKFCRVCLAHETVVREAERLVRSCKRHVLAGVHPKFQRLEAALDALRRAEKEEAK